jgi:hypothetical protein
MAILPSFLIIGAARSGTTTLYQLLGEHPEIFMPLIKEPHFFSIYWERGLDWYAQVFQGHSGQPSVGEASVSYTYPMYPDTPCRIAACLPDTRLLYIVRHPVDRAYSHYLYYRSNKPMVPLTFAEAIARDPIYVETSRYYQHILAYLQHFSQEQMLVLIFEDLISSQRTWLPRIYDFLGVEPSYVPPSIDLKTNVSFVPRSVRLQRLLRRLALGRPRMLIESRIPAQWRPTVKDWLRKVYGRPPQQPLDPDIRMQLLEAFRVENEQLAAFMGQDLSHWNS